MAKVCRLCLQVIGDSYYSIDENATESRFKIMILMPELEVDIVAQPVLCALCYGTLHAAYEFKCICLANEQRITNYLKNDKHPPINLCDLIEETDLKHVIPLTLMSHNFQANVNVIDFVKKENQLKPEPLEILCEFENVYEDSYKEVHVSANADEVQADKLCEDPLKGGIKCSNCSSEFMVLKEYKKHIAQCKFYECDLCNKKFMPKTKFLKHRASHNTDAEKDKKDSDRGMSANSMPEPDINNQSETEEYPSPQLEQDKSNQSATKGSVKCSNCSIEFTVWKVYRKHLETCSPYECDVCNKKFMLEGRFLRHKLTHKTGGAKSKSSDAPVDHIMQNPDEEENTKREFNKETNTNLDVEKEAAEQSSGSKIKLGIKCSKCRNKFMLKKDYMRHIRQCAPYQCDICNKKFMLEVRLHKHKLSHSTNSEQTFLCEVCSKTFRNAYLFGQHLLLHTGQKPFKCLVCDKMFATKHHLCQHKQTHKQRERRHECDICGKKFITFVVLRRHRITHSQEKKFFCNICDKGFNIKMYLQLHMKRHIGKKPYVCDICNSCFDSKSRLVEHYRSHTGERPYKCKMCEKSFAQSSTLRMHVQGVHSKEKPFSCEVCGKRFPLKRNLQSHSVLHMENAEKFPCPYCDKVFHLSNYLKQHVKRHTGDPTHVCTVCGKGFFTSCELKKHLRIHTGEKPFECEVCHQRYSQRYNLHVHMKVHSRSS